MIDYHLHTYLCGHAKGSMEDYVERAIKIGLNEIGFSGHFPLFWESNKEFANTLSIPEEKFPFYVEKVVSLREKYSQIKIKLGSEVDYVQGLESEIKKRVEKYPFDYVMGAIHFIGDFPFDHPDYIDEWKKRDVDEIYKSYFSSLISAINTGIFDIIAHPDLVKKFGFFPKISLFPFYEKVATSLKKMNMAFEINTSGLRKPVKEVYPSFDFLKILKKHNVPMTFGSDAHSPEDVGKDLNYAVDLAKRAGYTKYANFSGRNFTLTPIE